MKRSDIEQHLKAENYQLALDGLVDYGPSIWRDTAELRCLRALGRQREALHLAEQLARESNLVGDREKNDRARYIALVLTEQGKSRKACEIMAMLCKDSPNIPALQREYAFALASMQHYDRAEYHLRKAIALRPRNAGTHAQLAHIYCRMGRVDKGLRSYYRAASLAPDNPNYLERIAYWSNYSDAATQQSNYWIARLWAAKAHANASPLSRAQHSDNPDRVLRIAFVSPDFCAMPISFFVLPLLKGLDREVFWIAAYSDTRKSDGITQKIRSSSDLWRNTSRMTDTELTAQIGNDEIDILIDLSGHSTHNRLGVFAKQAAPIQISWLGYRSTTGLESIQYRITDKIADPPGQNDEYFSEQLIRLKNGQFCYLPLASAPQATRRPDNSPICFGSFNDLAKVSGITIDCWAAALRIVPESTLYLKRQQLTNDSIREYLIREFKLRGIRSERIRFEPSNAKIEDHLAQYNEIDVALDTSPYNGITTALEALWMGRPVITMAGKTHASRCTASLLHRLEMDDLVAKDPDEFALAAGKLCMDRKLLNEIHESLRSKMAKSLLTDKAQFGREFGEALRRKWRIWCRQQNDRSNSQQPGGRQT